MNIFKKIHREKNYPINTVQPMLFYFSDRLIYHVIKKVLLYFSSSDPHQQTDVHRAEGAGRGVPDDSAGRDERQGNGNRVTHIPVTHISVNDEDFYLSM